MSIFIFGPSDTDKAASELLENSADQVADTLRDEADRTERLETTQTSAAAGNGAFQDTATDFTPPPGAVQKSRTLDDEAAALVEKSLQEFPEGGPGSIDDLAARMVKGEIPAPGQSAQPSMVSTVLAGLRKSGDEGDEGEEAEKAVPAPIAPPAPAPRPPAPPPPPSVKPPAQNEMPASAKPQGPTSTGDQTAKSLQKSQRKESKMSGIDALTEYLNKSQSLPIGKEPKLDQGHGDGSPNGESMENVPAPAIAEQGEKGGAGATAPSVPETKLSEDDDKVADQLQGGEPGPKVQKVAEPVQKSGEEILDELVKAKYIRRTGTPGNYQYQYPEGPKGNEKIAPMPKTVGENRGPLTVHGKDIKANMSWLGAPPPAHPGETPEQAKAAIEKERQAALAAAAKKSEEPKKDEEDEAKKSEIDPARLDRTGHDRRDVAALERKLRKGQEDIEVGTGVPTPKPAQQNATAPSRFIRKGGVLFSSAADDQVDQMMKSDAFYEGSAPSIALGSTRMAELNACGCGSKFSKSLATCPSCGAGALVPEFGLVKSDAEPAQPTRRGPGLRPVRQADVIVGVKSK